MNRRRSWLFLATGFLLGTAFGWWSLRWYQQRPRDPQLRYQRSLQRLSRRLSLTPQQQTAAAAALSAERGRIEALRAQMESQLRQVHADTVAAIRRVLDPDQQKKLDEQEARFQQRMKSKAQSWRQP